MNPEHMEPVTSAENVRRGLKPGRELTHCQRGHEFTPENTIEKGASGNGRRACRECALMRSRRYYYQRMENPEWVEAERERNRLRMRAKRANLRRKQ